MYYYVKNIQGDIIKIVSSTGAVVANYAYNVWGELLYIKDAFGNSITDTSSIAYLNPLRYRGYVYDDETGLYYLQSRYYDPVTCRFINADIYCDTQTNTPFSTNMYAYCENNAIYNFDFSGKRPSGKKPSDNYDRFKYNCYAYAMGYNNMWLLPGKGIRNISIVRYTGTVTPMFWSDSMPPYYSVSNVQNWVLNDFMNTYSNGKRIVRVLKTFNSPISKDEYRIAMRVCIYQEIYRRYYIYKNKPLTINRYTLLTADFHFLKQNPKNGDWYQKQGVLAIDYLGKINPDNTKWWFNGSLPGNYYNSGTLYLAVKKQFWA